MGALNDCLDNSQHLKTNAKLGSKFSKDSIIAQMGTYKSQEKEKQSKENWTTEGCGRQFLLWNITGVSGNDIWEREWEWLNPFPNFGNGNGNDKLHSQLLGTGTGMKIPFPIFGNGNGNGNSIPEFWERE